MKTGLTFFMDKDTTFKMIMIGLLNQERERRNKVHRDRLERIKADPVLLAKHKAQKKKSEAGRRERVKADPARLAVRRASGKRNAQALRDRIYSDPALHAEWCKKVADKGRAEYARKKVEEPDFMDKHRARILRYNQTEKGKAIQNETQKRLRRESPNFRMAHMCRTRIASALRGRAKGGDLYELVGCTMDEYRANLERQFVEGMSWANWGNGVGKWNIDHIKPCASFDLSDVAQQKAAFHYTNTRPLWFIDNCSKSSIVDGKFHRYC